MKNPNRNPTNETGGQPRQTTRSGLGDPFRGGLDLGKPNLGISLCLLGEKVRFNGGHCHNHFVTSVMARYVNWIPVCPEMGAGLGTPREALRLVKREKEVHLEESRTGIDRTVVLHAFCETFLNFLSNKNPHGFILKRKSPSCGMERVPLYREDGHRIGVSEGVFAQNLRKRFPLIPIEEDGRLNDTNLRENFIERIYAYQRWSFFLANDPTPADLVVFHRRHKMQLTAHQPAVAKELGRIVGAAGTGDWQKRVDAYGEMFMHCLEQHAATGKHANVLYHLLGFLKDRMQGEDKREMIHHIEQYRRRHTPLSVPLALLNHHLRRLPHPWVQGQTYLQPYPADLRMGQLLR
ncbi:DUF523 DUF1722 domains-containing protein [Sulfidibacter corallicola]|uniref:DUF523 and DUF1722 domain-containing protein n=1 Tax=Sulfidibacter corallicola TaxID=2818388 RepID=A0A8A4TED2_SULCO|nr:DUF523 and DUF1722 domain-containing protein [Sulfidibacter corallicola]QTD47917.1 DUF523 and DUF1722 domain-containing protein [Sulfidibacter corallicola]